MNAETSQRTAILLPALQAALRSQVQEACMQVFDAYTLMDILQGGTRRLSWSLGTRREKVLMRSVAMAATVLRRQVWLAKGKAWFTPFEHGFYGWDPSREWLRMPPREAVGALREELHTIAVTLTNAAELLPEAWDAAISRCAGALLLVSAHLRDAVEGSAAVEGEPQGETRALA